MCNYVTQQLCSRHENNSIVECLRKPFFGKITILYRSWSLCKPSFEFDTNASIVFTLLLLYSLLGISRQIEWEFVTMQRNTR